MNADYNTCASSKAQVAKQSATATLIN